MKKLSRVLAVILALALCLPGMAAAEMTEAEKLAEMVANVVLPTPELPLVDEPMTITVKYPKTSNHGDFDNCFYLKAVEKLTNIKLDVQGIDANGWDESWRWTLSPATTARSISTAFPSTTRLCTVRPGCCARWRTCWSSTPPTPWRF